MFKLLESVFRKRAEAATAEFRDHRRKVRSRTQPLRIELVASPDTAWLNGAIVQPAVAFLHQAGFQPAGVFAVKGNDKIVIAGFANIQQCVFATVPKAGDQVFLSFGSYFTDDSVFESLNMPVSVEQACPEWLIRKNCPGASPQELWSDFLTTRPAKPFKPAPAESFAECNTTDYFRYQAWKAERGGATREELAARFKAGGHLPEGEEGEAFLTMARSDEIERSLCDWWSLQADAPLPLDEVLESLIIVHDELPPELVANAYWCGTNDFKVRNPDFADGTPREAFARVVDTRGGLLRKVFEKRTPLQADFYLPNRE